MEKLRAAERQQAMEEYNRLLYVALTRAEDRLLVCGWQGRNSPKDTCWHSLVRRGFESLEAEREPFAQWPGERLWLRSPQVLAPAIPAAAVRPDQVHAHPAWIGAAPDWTPAPPPPEPPRPTPLAPSRPEGVELGDVPAAESPLRTAGSRFRRGQLIHTLLQHLPSVPDHARLAAAIRWLDNPGHGLAAGEADRIADEVLVVMAHGDLAPLFGPDARAEVPLTGVVGDVVVAGQVDRMAVLPDRVLLADFKTNRRTPARVEDTPRLYLRQMASYRAVLRVIFPDRPVRCALIWTREARVTVLPDDILDPHEPGHARDAARAIG
jgi:ATP-dependent helicase/nuclease subunit A